MVEFFTRAQQSYGPLVNANTGNPLDNTPRPFTFTPSIPAGKSIRGVRFRLTRVAWPLGLCLQLQIIKPDGDNPGIVGFDGGNTLARDGTETCAIEIRPEDGDPDLPTGQYTFNGWIWQPITGAVTGLYW